MKRQILIALVICSFAPTGATAQSVIEVLVGLKFCKTLKDDTQRLKCFDDIVPDKTAAQPPKEKPDAELVWNVQESKSPLDDSPQVLAILPAISGQAELMLRCREKHTEVGFVSSDFIYFGTDQVRALVRFGDSKLIETRWSPSTSGRGAFAPSPVQFIRALVDDGKVFVRLLDRQGKSADGEFKLGKVSDVREKISQACKWPGDKPAKP